MKRDTQITGNTGLFYCCYRLSRLGWNVMPTARNARGVDIVIYTQDASRYLGIQVKTLSKRAAVPLGKSLDKVMGDFWVIINQVATSPAAHVLLPDEVKQLASQSGKGDQVSYWLERKHYEQERFQEAWERIGPGS